MIASVSTLILASAIGALAAPAPLLHGKPEWTAVAERNVHYKPNGPAALYKAYRKWGMPIPEDLHRAAHREITKRAASQGEAQAIPSQDDNEYSVKTSIGTPAQSLMLDFDTGSSDLWVFSASLSQSKKSGHNVFSSSKSSTYKKLSGYSWEISYGDGSSASGHVGTDVVTVGGVTYRTQAVETATTISDEFVSDTSVDGLLGLGFSSINTVTPVQQTTFFENIAPSLTKPLFVADLRHQQTSYYDFGYVDSSKYVGTLNQTTVDSSSGWWEFSASNGYYVGSTHYSGSSGQQAIADTGTTLLLVSSAAVKNYYAKVSGASYDSSQGGYTFPCSAKLPNMQIAVGSKYATVSGTYINFAPVDDTGATCFGGVQAVPSTQYPLIYGDIFFKSNLVVFSLGSGASTSGAFMQWGAKPAGH